MARGPKKHLKRMNAPNHWMLDKLTGVYAPRPSSGPHKLRECIPLAVLLKNKLKYALNGNEVKKIVRDKAGLIKVDNRTRKDPGFPLGFMDVVSIDKTGEHYRILLDVKGRYFPHKINAKEATYKLLKIKKKATAANKVPYLSTHDGRTIRYPKPDVTVGDTVRYNLETGEIEGHYKYGQGSRVLIIGGNNIGRVGNISHIERIQGAFDIVHIKDTRGKVFATRDNNVFVLGAKSAETAVSLPRGSYGVKYSIIEERDNKDARED